MIRLSTRLVAGLAIAIPPSAMAQSMGGMNMPGITMPAPVKKPAAKPVDKKPTVRRAAAPALKAAPKARAFATQPAPDHDMAAMPGMDMSAPESSSSDASMAGMDMSADADSGEAVAIPGMMMTGTALPAGNAAPPAPPTDHYADRFFPAGDIAQAHHAMMRENGGQTFSQIMFNLAEVQVRNGKDGYRWDGEGWFGGDLNRLVIKTEGEGVFREGVEAAEVQALYSHAFDPYFNLQVGVRHDFRPTPNRTYASVGFEGLAPYWFEVGGALFLSDKGDVLGRLEGYYDQRITQRLILQPRIELNLAAQDVPESRIGAGLSNAELGLRLRYEFSRQFAPYLGVSYDAKTGQTADYARADGKKATSASLVAGVHFWF